MKKIVIFAIAASLATSAFAMGPGAGQGNPDKFAMKKAKCQKEIEALNKCVVNASNKEELQICKGGLILLAEKAKHHGDRRMKGPRGDFNRMGKAGGQDDDFRRMGNQAGGPGKCAPGKCGQQFSSDDM